MIAPSYTPVNLVPPCFSLQVSSELLPSDRESNPPPQALDVPAALRSEQGRSVLVIDDVSDVTEMLSVLLTHAGYQVSAASSAYEAMALAEKQRFDLIISDIGMPEMNGYELAMALRARPGYESVPMVAVTGFSMFDDRNRSLTAGFNAHVTKPIDPRTFLDLIEQL